MFVSDVIGLLQEDTHTNDEIEAQVLEWTGDTIVARRLIDWVPEAFGFVALSHMKQLTLDTTFQAQSGSGDWLQFDFESEPVFLEARRLAMSLFHDGPKDRFWSVANRSSMVTAVNRMLSVNPAAHGRVSGPAMIGLPAAIYMDGEV